MKFLNGIELLFCHRWLLLCFRREVGEYQARRIWEASWSQHHTSYFHLFLCTAAIALYGDAVIKKNLSPDLTLLHFTSIQEMDGDLLLNKAQELLYEFLVQDIIPCSLIKILSDPGDWDSPPTPTIYCKCDGFHANSGIPTLLDVVHSRSNQDDKGIENNCAEASSECVEVTQPKDNMAKVDLNSSENTSELKGNAVIRDDDNKTFVTNPNNVAVDHEANKEASKTSEDEAINISSSTSLNNTIDSTIASTVCENIKLGSDSPEESITEGDNSPTEANNVMEASRSDVEGVTEICDADVSSSSITRLESEKTQEADSTRDAESINKPSRSGSENVNESCDVDVNSSSITTLEPEKTKEADSTRESKSNVKDIKGNCDVDINPASTRMEPEETEGKQVVNDSL